MLKKNWKKINEEIKATKKKRRQEKLLKSIDQKLLTDAVETNTRSEEVRSTSPSTISVAVPGSILENTQSPELCTYVAGQIARAISIFGINEVIVFDDGAPAKREQVSCDNAATIRKSCLQLARILQYLECPQYLRKFFFPIHKDLKYSGLLNPLDAPHHLRYDSHFPYREGVVTEKPAKAGHCFANIGLSHDVLVDKAISPGIRVTVRLDKPNGKKLHGKVVSQDEPLKKLGVYWGYNVRIAHSLSEVFSKSPYDGGYDITIGTSDRGTDIHQIESYSMKYNHMLIVFGGLLGIESALANEENLKIDNPALLFDHYINVLPNQGSRTIRTEEAILIALSALQIKIDPQVPQLKMNLKEYLPSSEDTGYA